MELDPDTEAVIVMPTENTGWQTCYMGYGLMLKLNAKIGEYVKIQRGRKATIGQVWPGSTLDQFAIHYRDIVYSYIVKSSVASVPECKANKISLISAVYAQSVTVSVIVNSLEKIKEYKEFSTGMNCLTDYCRNCLYRLCIAKSYTVNCTNMKLGSLYGISYFVINDARSSSSSFCDYYIITRDTELVIETVHSKEWFEQFSRQKANAPNLGGLVLEIQMLKDLIQLPLDRQQECMELGVDPPKGLLLRGPPGCGKTSLVQCVSEMCQACLLVVNGPEIFAPLPGETEENLKRIFNRAVMLSEEGPCILFIDEIDSLCPRRGSSSKTQESRVTGQFLLLMDGLRIRNNILVIGATNRPSALDPAMRRPGRFDREVMIGAPTMEQRKAILLSKIQGLPIHSDLDLNYLASVTNGYVGADLASLCHEAAYLAMEEGKTDCDVKKICQAHFQKALRNMRPSVQKGTEGLVDLRPVYWSDIGGLDNVKAQIKQAVEWPIKHPDAFHRMGLSPPKGVLLYGSPGCCKTTLVRAAATACRATFLAISGAQLYLPYVGDSERLIAEVFQKARACTPAIILLDEIDSIVGKRSVSAHSGVQERVLSALLNEMDGIGVRLDDGAAIRGQQKLLEGDTSHISQDQNNTSGQQTTVNNQAVLVVAATNRPDLLDEALVRPGRIDKVVYVPQPDREARKQILKIYSGKFNLSDDDLEEIAEKTDWYTGADLENLCREAALCALTDDMSAAIVTVQHLHKALRTVKPSLTPKLVQLYSSLNMYTFKTP